jgi:hypothetical protein
VRHVGTVTRGTTSLRRLRRVDRWLLDAHPGLVRARGLLAVDVGFGTVPVTTAELHARLRRINPTVTVVGVEIDPERVASAAAWSRDGLRFERGGFELAGHRPQLVRAFNVLRQYDEDAVAGAWRQMSDALGDGGVVVEGTCDELGRLGAWVTLDRAGPRSLTLALDPGAAPSAVAARLPKALIHRNVAGEAVNRLLADLDGGWRRAAPLGVFSARQRVATAIAELGKLGWPVLDGPARWRRAEVTVAWSAVSPSTNHDGAGGRSR